MKTFAIRREGVRLLLVIGTIVVAAICFVRRTTGHPEFGVIHVAGMAMKSPSPTTVWEQAEIRLRSWLHLQQRYGPESDYGLQVGPAVLGWSYANNTPTNRDGYVYLCDVRPSGGNAPLWEIALGAKDRLRDVTSGDIPTEFYGMGDPRGTNAFGSAWWGRTILVPEGQLLFARLESDPSVVYIVRLARQRGVQTGDWATMKIEYVVATNQPPHNRRVESDHRSAVR